MYSTAVSLICSKSALVLSELLTLRQCRCVTVRQDGHLAAMHTAMSTQQQPWAGRITHTQPVNKQVTNWAFTRYDRWTDWSVRLVGPTIVSCKRFVRPVGQTVGRIKYVWFRPTADPTVEACGHYVRLVGPTGQSDDQSRFSVGGTCCLRYSYIAAAVIYMSGG